MTKEAETIAKETKRSNPIDFPGAKLKLNFPETGFIFKILNSF